MEYRSILAQKLMQLGYELNIGKKGTFEIVGVPESVLNIFSKRRSQIEKWLSDQDLTGGEAASLANFQTRARKTNVNDEELKVKWTKELEASGSSLDELNHIAKIAEERGPIKLPDPYLVAERSVADAVEHLSQRQSTFTIPEVMKSAKQFSIFPCSDGDFLKIIEQKIADKALLFMEGKHLVTPQILQLEAQIVDSVLTGKGSVNAMLARWIANYASKSKLKIEKQQAALTFMLTNRDQQIFVSADSQNMLVDVLKTFNAVCIEQGYFPRLLTQRKTNIEKLTQKTDIERTTTIEGFLLSCEVRAEHQLSSHGLKGRLRDWTNHIVRQQARNVWIIDGEVSNQQINRLQHWSKHFGARLIFVEAKKQSHSVMSSLKNKGLSNVHISINKVLKEDLSVQDKLKESIKYLEIKNALQSVPDNENRLKLVAKNFKGDTLLIAQNNTHRIRLNELVREQLKEQGHLSRENIVVDTLQPIFLSSEEKKHAHLYNLNDVIHFKFAIPNSLITKNSYFVVNDINLKTGHIELHNQQNTQIYWNPSEENTRFIEVFRAEKREVAVGDKLVWAHTLKHEKNEHLTIVKNQMTTVSAIRDDAVSVTLIDDKKVVIDLKDFKNLHFDHGYTALLKNAKTTPFLNIILCLQSHTLDKGSISDLSSILDTALGSSKKIHIFCDDIEKLIKNIAGNIPEKASIHEIPYVRKEALKHNQTTVTQQIFHGLQAEYLKTRKLNPEFLDKNAPKPIENRHYSPEFRIASDVVDYVTLYHSERQSVISLKTIKKEAYEMAGAKIPTHIIDGAIECALTRGWLVKVPNLNISNNQNETLVCARHVLLMEKLCIQKMKAGQNQLVPIVPQNSPMLQEIQNHSRLTKGQKEAVSLILTTKDKVVAIQGVAGAGKTTALKEINKYCQMQAYNPLVLASTGSARNQAQKASNIPSMTTAQFLTRVETLLTTDIENAQKEFGGNRLIILDEFSLISTRDMFRLITAAEELNVRLGVMGDIKQIGSIGAGEISPDLLAYGIRRAAMVENVRLKNPTALEAMKHAYAGDMSKTLYTLRDSIEEIPVKAEALSRIVDIYVCLKPERRAETLIITPLNEDRNFINRAIREKLKEREELQGNALVTDVFLPCDRREIEKSNILSYELGDHIRFKANNLRLGIQAGEYREVCEIDIKHHRLTLKNDQNEKIYCSTQNLKKPSDIEIYRQEKRELMKNDVVIFKRNNDELDIYNGDKAQVLEISGTLVTLSLMNEKVINLDLIKSEHQHLDYGYALTAYAGQGRDIDFVLAYGDGPKPLNKKESDIKVGDTVVLPKEMQPKEKYVVNSKLVAIQEINHHTVTLKDFEGHIHTLNAEKDRLWDYFPPFEERREHELPLSTTQKSFLVQITRGDNLCLIVPNINDFQKTLDKHKGNKDSALRYFDPHWKTLNRAVERLVENINGKAELRRMEEISQEKHLKQSPNKIIPAKTLHYQSIPTRVDIDELERRLADNALEYAKQWLGSPNRVTGREARWGRKGSFSLTLNGPKAGVWRNHEIGKGGKGLVSLYMDVYNVSWKEAVKELAKENDTRAQKIIHHASKASSKEVDNNERYRTNKIHSARKVYNQAIPIQGTLAEKYLRNERGISGSLPNDFRFKADVRHLDTLKPTPALIAPYRDKNNDIIGVVRVFLGPDGVKYRESFIDATGKEIEATRKANLGLSSGGSVILKRGKMTDSIFIAEGIETALSISNAAPNQTVVASLSAHQLKNVPVGPGVQKVIICADNDPASAQTKQSIIEAVERYLSEGRRVFIAIPPEIPMGLKKYDFNDLLKQKGVAVIREVLDQKIEIKCADALKIDEPRLAIILQNMPKAQQTISIKLDHIHSVHPKSQSINREFER